MYRKEAKEQGRVSGFDLTLSAKQGPGRYGWHVDASFSDKSVRTEFDVLVWSDIVRGSMDAGVLETYRLLFKTAWTYIGSGTLRRLMWLRKGPVIAALYPIFILLFQLMFACVIALGIGAVIAQFMPLLSLVAILIVPIALKWFKNHDGKIFAYYLMHDYAYSAQSKGAVPEDLEARIGVFKGEIAMALQENYDAVLVVGHSSGAHLAISILADLDHEGRIPERGAKLGFLSLGHVVPMVSFLPDAWRLRRDLARLSTSDRLVWYDVSAPANGCSFALCDPVMVSGVGHEGQKWPVVFSAAFSKRLSAEKWKAIKRRYFKLHFQYLCAFDRPRDYDYFSVTAGPVCLAKRYKNRGHSNSRITVNASKFTSVTP